MDTDALKLEFRPADLGLKDAAALDALIATLLLPGPRSLAWLRWQLLLLQRRQLIRSNDSRALGDVRTSKEFRARLSALERDIRAARTEAGAPPVETGLTTGSWDVYGVLR